MKLLLSIASIFVVFSCQQQQTNTAEFSPWHEARTISAIDLEHLTHGKTYLPVYSEIYHLHDRKTYNLTVTISLRNVSEKDTVYVTRADFYNTEGHKIRSYYSDPIIMTPLETVEIVIDETDAEGGTGGNFIFDWSAKNPKNPPLFEAVMISTTGQQGLSFTTRGVEVFD